MNLAFKRRTRPPIWWVTMAAILKQTPEEKRRAVFVQLQRLDDELDRIVRDRNSLIAHLTVELHKAKGEKPPAWAVDVLKELEENDVGN